MFLAHFIYYCKLTEYSKHSVWFVDNVQKVWIEAEVGEAFCCLKLQILRGCWCGKAKMLFEKIKKIHHAAFELEFWLTMIQRFLCIYYITVALKTKIERSRIFRAGLSMAYIWTKTPTQNIYFSEPACTFWQCFIYMQVLFLNKHFPQATHQNCKTYVGTKFRHLFNQIFCITTI